ncbi:MAG: hypothetical protein ABSG60_08965 [Terracidiphilus sp.]|jgi:hypothetical protein
MKRMLCILPLVLAAVLCNSQSTKDSAKPDLSKFSSDQLKACFDDSKVCGSSSVWDISDELASRLPALTTEQLLACFANWKICGVGEDQASGWPISDELARRGDPHDLLVRYWKEPNWLIRNGIEHVAYHFNTPEVTAFMQRVLAQRKKDGEDFYWPANYLAKKCDPTGLKELSTGRHRNQGSLQYQTTLVLFGKCQYRLAIPYLAGEALYDFSLNIVGAAEESLKALYPDHPREFKTLEDEQKYYCRRAKQEGFKVDCESK